MQALSEPGHLQLIGVGISLITLTATDGRTVERWQQSFQVSNGVISIDL